MIQSAAADPATLYTPFAYQVDATDPDGDPLSYEIDAFAQQLGLVIDADTGLITWTPEAVGTAPVSVRVSDGLGGIAFDSFDVQVDAPVANTPPRVTSTVGGSLFVGQEFTYQLAAEDFEDGVSPDPDLTFSLDTNSLARGVTLAATGGLLSWTPTQEGTFETTVTVTDSEGASGSQLLTLPVNPAARASRPPVFTSNPVLAVVEGGAYAYLAEATDPDATGADPVVYGLLGDVPSWLTIQAGGLLSGVTDMDAAGDTHVLQVTATHGNETTIQRYTLQVTSSDPNANNAPVVEPAPGLTATTGGSFRHAVVARDADDDPLTFHLVDATGLPLTSDTGFRISAEGEVSRDLAAFPATGTGHLPRARP